MHFEEEEKASKRAQTEGGRAIGVLLKRGEADLNRRKRERYNEPG